MQLNYRDSKPIYEQIKEGIRRMIVMNGTFVADAKTARQSMTRNLKILFDQVVTELFVLETPVEELRTRMDDAKEQLSMEDDLVRFVTQDMQTEDVVTEGNDDTDK